jgi:hypothetical protein
LKPLLSSLSHAMQVLRNADWNDQADGSVSWGLPPAALPSPALSSASLPSTSLGTGRAGRTPSSSGAGAEGGGRQ